MIQGLIITVNLKRLKNIYLILMHLYMGSLNERKRRKKKQAVSFWHFVDAVCNSWKEKYSLQSEWNYARVLEPCLSKYNSDRTPSGFERMLVFLL